MASEKNIENVLNLLTKAPTAHVESLAASPKGHAKSLRRIIATKNIVAVGISEKISQRKRSGKLALTFYVERKVPLSRLKADMMIPPTVPEALSGPQAIPTDVIVLGKIRPEVNVTRSPVQPGNSIGHVKITAGTLGAIVKRGKEHYLLSNSHVLALSGTAKKGDSVIYPGDADGGKMPADLVANLSAFKKFTPGGAFVNRVDCALAKPVAGRRTDLVAQIKGLTIPKGTMEPVRGMKVVKVGRTTGKTVGEVRDVHFRFTLDYDEAGEVGFLDQVLCSRYTKPGDSGALVLEQKSGRAVGLHFAGANGGSVFNPISQVLSALNVELVTQAMAAPQAAAKRKKAVKKPRG